MKTLAKWTIEEYHRPVDSGLPDRRRVELIAGGILEMTPESPFHAFVTDSAAEYLQTLLRGTAIGRASRTSALSDSEPDKALVRSPRQQYSDRHPGAAGIFRIIQIPRSTLEYDLTVKKASTRAPIFPSIGRSIASEKGFVVSNNPRQKNIERVLW
jgi:hypothetical protein